MKIFMRLVLWVSLLLLSLPTVQAGFDEAVAAANDSNFAVAYKEFLVLAEQDDARAQQALAWMYYEGQGRERDYGKAAYWYRRAAEQGNITAQINLAQMHAYGKGVQQDFTEAAHWWKKLADQGDVKSQVALAGLYYQGAGLERDFEKAVRLWREAAQQGSIEAQRNLGLMYGKGRGVVQDDVQAFAWLSVAAIQDDEVAAKSRDYAQSQLNAEQRKKAGILAHELIEKFVEPFGESPIKENKSPR